MSLPKLHFHQAKLFQVSAELKRSEDGVFFCKHDQGWAGKASVDI